MEKTSELRNWYLSNLGIVQYVPKGEASVALPFHSSSQSSSSDVSGGRVESEKALDSAHDQSGINTDHKTSVASVLELVGDKADIQADIDSHVELDTSDHSITVVDEPNSSPALSFRLACWHPCDDMLVFNQLIPGEQPDQSQNLLLSNILKAIGRLPNGLPEPELFDWPIDSTVGESVDHSESGAKDMLSVFLDARIRKYGVLWVLLMGEQSSELLSPKDKPYPELLGHIEEIAGGAQTIVVRSLQDMLSEPATKSETWQTIRRLAE